MSADAKVVPIGSASSMRASDKTRAKLARLPAAVHVVQDKCKLNLVKALNQVFDNADDALFELADKAGNNHDQNLFFESMREVRLRRRVMESAFVEEIDKAFSQLSSSQIVSEELDHDEPSLDNLQLVQNDELEELVAIDSMISKAARGGGEILQHLSLRLDSLVPLKVYQKNNPIGPDAVCKAFATTAKLLDADIKAKLVLFKLFEKYVVSTLTSLYESLNTLLIEQDILPSLVPGKIKRQPAATTPANTTIPGAGTPSNTAGIPQMEGGVVQGSQPQPAPVGQAPVNQVPMSQRPMTQGTGNDVGQNVDVGLIMNALSQLQTQQVSSENLLQQPANIEAAHVDIRQLIATALTSQAPQGQQSHDIGGTERDVINLVKVLFEFILDDRNLAEPMKALIGRLQIPVLKVALLDNSFFSKTGHPARRLLNEMATAALGWNENGKTQEDLLKDALYQKIATVVQTLLGEFDSNVEIFTDLLADFVSFIEKERKRARIIEQRTIDAESGKAQAEAARQYVAEQLEVLRGESSIPDPVNKVLDVAWSNVLFLIYLKDGTGNDIWRGSLETAKDLIWSVVTPITQETRSQLMTLLPSLLKRLRNGLESISYNPYEMTQLLGELKTIHLDRLRAPIDESVVVETAPALKSGLPETLNKTPDNTQSAKLQTTAAKPAERPKVEVVPVSNVLPVKTKQEKAAETVTLKGKTKSGVKLQVVTSSNPSQNPSVIAPKAMAQKPTKSTPTGSTDIGTKSASNTAKSNNEASVRATANSLTKTQTDRKASNQNESGNKVAAQPYHEQVSKLTQGAWFEKQQGEGSEATFRCRLAAIIKATGVYIFVNRSGQKVAEESAKGLALALQNGSMKALDDGMLFDRALQSVIGDMRKSRHA